MARTKIAHALKVLANYVVSFGPLAGSLQFIYDLSRWTMLPNAKRFSVRTPQGQSVSLRARSSDFLVYDEVLLQQCYSLRRLPQQRCLEERYSSIIAAGKTPLIIDAGANIGLAAIGFKAEFPAAKIICLEPVQGNFNLAKKNLEPLDNIELLQKGLWHCRSTLVMENEDAKAFSFSFKQEVRSDKPGIEALTIDDILNDQIDADLFILKIDIEGAEADILSAPGNWWQKGPVLMIEPHDWRGGGRQSLRGILQKPAYQDGDVIVKDDILIFLPLLAANETERARSLMAR